VREPIRDVRERLAALYGRTGARVAVVLATRFGIPREVAIDAVQDVFVTLLEKRAIRSRVVSLGADESFRYLLRSCYHGALKEMKRQERTARSLGGLREWVGQDAASVSRTAEQTQEVILAEIGRLPPPYGEVLRLFLLERKAAGEIAVQLGRPRNTVYQQVKRGLKRLRGAVDRALAS